MQLCIFLSVFFQISWWWSCRVETCCCTNYQK